MADFVSHHLFGEQTQSVFPAPVQELIGKHPVSFRWGCQGPDPLFYRKYCWAVRCICWVTVCTRKRLTNCLRRWRAAYIA